MVRFLDFFANSRSRRTRNHNLRGVRKPCKHEVGESQRQAWPSPVRFARVKHPGIYPKIGAGKIIIQRTGISNSVTHGYIKMVFEQDLESEGMT